MANRTGKSKIVLTTVQWKLIKGSVLLVTIALLYIYNLEFRINFPIILVFAFVGTAYWVYSTFKSRKQSALINQVRRRLQDFQPDRQVKGVGNRTGLLVDQKRCELAIYTNGTNKVGAFSYRDLIRSEIIEDGGSVTSTARGSQLAGAVVGNVLLGGAGLIIGGLSGKKRSQSTVSKVSIAVTVKDTGSPLWTVVLLDLPKPILKSSSDASHALNAANEIHALLSVFIRKADDEDKSAASAHAAPPAPQPAARPPRPDRGAFAEEFLKLAKLKEQGILSETEFVEMKTALIVQAKQGAAK